LLLALAGVALGLCDAEVLCDDLGGGASAALAGVALALCVVVEDVLLLGLALQRALLEARRLRAGSATMVSFFARRTASTAALRAARSLWLLRARWALPWVRADAVESVRARKTMHLLMEGIVIVIFKGVV
jgi:hypothetical protein